MIRASFGKTTAGRLLLGAGAVALLIPAIAGCEAGENAPTLEYHNASAGAQTIFNGIRISDAFVLGAPTGAVPAGSSAGLFLSLFNDSSDNDTLTSASTTGATSVALSGSAVALPVGSEVNLMGPEPKVVLNSLTAPLASGSYVKVTLDFSHAGSVSLQVPVESQQFYYSTYSAAPTPTPTASATAATPTPKATKGAVKATTPATATPAS